MKDNDNNAYNAYESTCASHAVLETLSKKWVYLVISALRHDRMRNADLARKLNGISPKMLSQTLRMLEHDGLVNREVFAEVPPRVEYELTPLGHELGVLMDSIRLWAETHAPEIIAARAR